MATRREVMSSTFDVAISSETAAQSWPVYWSAIIVGALAAVAAALLGGLLAVAFRAYDVTPGRVGPGTLSVGELAASVCIGFFSFVIAGWGAARIAGLRRAEPAMLHGAIAWLVAVPFLFALVAFGARSYLGAWYGGLAGAPIWSAPGAPIAAKAAREMAGGAATSLLLGLVGAIIGGWLGSGEPMTFTHYRTRQP